MKTIFLSAFLFCTFSAIGQTQNKLSTTKTPVSEINNDKSVENNNQNNSSENKTGEKASNYKSPSKAKEIAISKDTITTNTNNRQQYTNKKQP